MQYSLYAEQDMFLRQSGWIATHRSSFAFTARACHSDVSLTLTTVPFSADHPEVKVVIGAEANQQTKIIHVSRNGSTIEHTMHTPNVLDCFDMRPFWISWERGTLKFGKGETLDDAFTSPDPVGEITGVLLMSYSKEAMWSYSRDEGVCDVSQVVIISNL